MKFFQLLIIIFALPHIMYAQGDNCSNPKVINVTCPATTLTGETTSGLNNDNPFSIWYSTPGNDMVYQLNAPVGSLYVVVSVNNASMPLVIMSQNSCGSSNYTSYSYVAYSQNNMYLPVTGNSPVYLWIDHNNATDITFDISFGLVTSSSYINIPDTRGNLTFATNCISPLTKPPLDITYNGAHMSLPLNYQPLNTPGQLCAKIFLKNTTGQEGPKKIEFSFGPDMQNFSPAGSSFPGFYNSGTWTASTTGNTLTYTFADNASLGYGDFNPQGTKNCLPFEFCFNVTPVSHDPIRTEITVKIYKDSRGLGFRGYVTTGCCATAGSCNIGGGAGAGAGTLGIAFNDPNALPVTILNFSGAAVKNTVQLNWTTASEQNSSEFIIERSADGTFFEEAGQVAAAGNSAALSSYTFTDYQFTGPVAYYRLKETDKDGTITYSKIISIRSQAETAISISPIPAGNFAEVRSTETWTSIELVNIAGKVLFRETHAGNYARIDLSKDEPGLYLLIIQTAETKEIRKIYKE